MSNIVYPKYLIDTNVLVQAHRLYYQFDFCNGFWNWILTLNDGGCLGIDKVYEEIIKNKDELANWIKNKKNLFLQFDSTSISYFKDIYSILNNNGVPQNKITNFVDNTKADVYLIAFAKAHGCTLITHEASAGKINAKRKVHIPDVCKEMGVPYTTIYEVMRSDSRFCLQLSSR